MRVQTLNTYVITKLKDYYKKPLRFKSLLKDSENDSRLGELAQAYFLLKSDQEKADQFIQSTHERFFIETFKISDQKYVYQFNKQVKSRMQINMYARKRLRKLFEEDNLSKYKVAKELGTNQSNLSEFYYKHKNNKLDANKVLDKYGW